MGSFRVDLTKKGTQGVKQGCLGFAGDKTRRYKLLYLPMKMRQGLINCLVDSGATFDFTSAACTTLNAEQMLVNLTLIIELKKGSKLVLKKRA